jgi:hypothetical protein
MGTVGGSILIEQMAAMEKPGSAPTMTKQRVWLIAVVGGAVLLLLLFWDYLWINLIHSGSVDPP